MRKKNIFCLICFVMLLLVVPVRVVWAGDVGEGGNTTENPGDGGDTSTEHEHEWEYIKITEEREEKIKATCSAESCTQSGGVVKISLNINGKKPIYEGEEYEVKVENIENLELGEEAPKVEYYKVEEKIEKPIKQGDYIAKITFINEKGENKEVTLEQEFSIEKMVHVHKWEYEKFTEEGEEKIKATCSAGSCTQSGGVVKISLNINGKKPIYEGEEYEVKVENIENLELGEEAPKVEYYKVEEKIEKPIKQGDYIAKITFINEKGENKEVTLEQEFSIEKMVHVHKWEYEKFTEEGEEKIKATCSAGSCTQSGGVVKISLNINGKKPIYEGEEYEVKVENIENLELGEEAPKVEYYKVEEKIEKPIKQGDYIAKITFINEKGENKEVTLEQEFSIEKMVHVHKWEYEKFTEEGEEKIKATCSAGSCTQSGGVVKISLNINGKKPIYEGEEYEVKVENIENLELGEEAPKVEYYKVEEKIEKPTKKGAYLLRVIFFNIDGSSVVLEKKFEIICKHEITSILNARESTCITTGYTGDIICSSCGELQKKGSNVSAKGYKWDTGKVTTPSSDDAEGEFTYTCTNGCKHTKTEIIPRKSVSIELGKKAKIISSVSVCQKMTLAKVSKYKKYLTFNTKTGEIKTKKYYKVKISKSIPVKVFVGGKEYTVNIKIKIPAPKVKVTRKAVKNSFGKYQRYTFKYNVKGANRIKVRVENANKTGKSKTINKIFDRYVKKSKSNKSSYIEFTDKTMKKLKKKNGKVTFKIIAYYGKNQSETLTITK